jgi:hypothetical protein
MTNDYGNIVLELASHGRLSKHPMRSPTTLKVKSDEDSLLGLDGDMPHLHGRLQCFQETIELMLRGAPLEPIVI